MFTAPSHFTGADTTTFFTTAPCFSPKYALSSFFIFKNAPVHSNTTSHPAADHGASSGSAHDENPISRPSDTRRHDFSSSNRNPLLHRPCTLSNSQR